MQRNKFNYKKKVLNAPTLTSWITEAVTEKLDFLRKTIESVVLSTVFIRNGLTERQDHAGTRNPSPRFLLAQVFQIYFWSTGKPVIPKHPSDIFNWKKAKRYCTLVKISSRSLSLWSNFKDRWLTHISKIWTPQSHSHIFMQILWTLNTICLPTNMGIKTVKSSSKILFQFFWCIFSLIFSISFSSSQLSSVLMGSVLEQELKNWILWNFRCYPS